MNRACCYPVKAFEMETKLVFAYFETAADGTITGAGALDSDGVTSVERVAEGQYKLHLRDTWPDVLSVHVCWEGAAQDSKPYIVGKDLSSSTDPYITIGFLAVGADADINSAKVRVTFFFKNSRY